MFMQNSSAPIALVLGGAGLAVLAWRKPRLRGTTLMAPWWWSVVSLLALAGSDAAIGLTDPMTPHNWIVPLRFAAAMSSFAPTMALLGAKRPQDRAWQFIVFSLWLIVSLPAGHWLLFGGAREIHPAQFWFLIILVGVGVLNGIATRYWPSAVLYGLGQLALLAAFDPSTANLLLPARGPLVGLALMIAAWALLAVGWPWRRASVAGLDRVWLDFRDLYGSVWGLRIMERMNASAAMYDWPVQLAWQGFIPRNSEAMPSEAPPIVEDSLRTLLRRFVSSEWIDGRLERASETTTEKIPAG